MTDKKTFLSFLKRKETWQAIAAALFFVALLYLGSRLISTKNVSERLANAGFFAPLAFIGLKALTNIIAPLSGNPLYLSAVPLFGFRNGFVYLFAGDIIGYTANFFLARLFGQRIVKAFFSDKQMTRLGGAFTNLKGWKSSLPMAGAFFSFPDLMSYGAGLVSLSYWKFCVIILPIVVLKIILLTLVGSTFVANQKSFLAVAVITTILPVAVVLMWKYFKRSSKRS